MARRRTQKAVPLSPAERRRGAAVFTELTGQRLVKGRIPAALPLALATLRQQAQGEEVFVLVRQRRGVDCAQEAEIAGFYRNDLAPGQACLGPAAVLAKLNGAAALECRAKLTCPKDCPCEYEPLAQLADYTCANGKEAGYLLQRKTVWNCRCRFAEDPE